MATHYAHRGWCRSCEAMTDWVRADGSPPACAACAARFSDRERAWLIYEKLRFQAGQLTEYPEAVKTVGVCGGRYGAPRQGGRR